MCTHHVQTEADPFESLASYLHGDHPLRAVGTENTHCGLGLKAHFAQGRAEVVHLLANLGVSLKLIGAIVDPLAQAGATAILLHTLSVYCGRKSVVQLPVHSGQQLLQPIACFL